MASTKAAPTGATATNPVVTFIAKFTAKIEAAEKMSATVAVLKAANDAVAFLLSSQCSEALATVNVEPVKLDSGWAKKVSDEYGKRALTDLPDLTSTAETLISSAALNPLVTPEVVGQLEGLIQRVPRVRRGRPRGEGSSDTSTPFPMRVVHNGRVLWEGTNWNAAHKQSKDYAERNRLAWPETWGKIKQARKALEDTGKPLAGDFYVTRAA